jgi:predicted nuclease of predicted toxin-antitoxin system
MDVHIPAAIADGLRRNSIDVLTSQEDQTRTADDEDLLKRATSLGRLLFTQDEDFLAIADTWQQSSKHFAGILFAAQIGTSIGQMIADIQLIAEVCSPQEVAERVIYLPLK